MRELFFKKRGQMTIFIIVAIIIVALVSLFFILRDDTSLRGVPDDLQPVYNDFQNCIESNVMEGVSILESQGGYIYLPGYRNSVDPFSSWFYFSGTSIPYWQYEQGGITFEQVPTKKEMENQLERYLESNIQDCSFQEYEEQGFSINKGENISSNIEIKESRLEVSLNMDLTVEKEDNSYSLEKHSTRVKSYLGSLYDSAVKIYEKEKTTLFLEEYGIDVLRLYAPVDGLEIQCSPLIWDADNVFSELEDALETNTFALSSGERFQNQDDYFKQDLDIDNNARFLNSQDWEHSFEVLPSEGDKLISEPVGNNKALGALGFCYNTYHFVYDLKYPVLVQVYNENSFNEGGETFQFPLGVVIKGNKPREPLKGEAKEQQPIDICGDKNVNMTISTYDRQAQG
ncbi:MAG TPA: hypothetical protein VJ912_00400, partial [Candidatus Nanoarchaeia archaeon]|nr:hypothetical protein [Candidatus Nanoarchaeia archaeon]